METVREVAGELKRRGIEYPGSATSTRKFESGCPLCGGSGFALFWTDGEAVNPHTCKPYRFEYAMPCPECNGGCAQRADDARGRSAIPSAFYDARLKDFDWTLYPGVDLKKQRERVRAFINRFPDFEREGMGLYVFSRTKGSGKTLLASAVTNELISLYALSARFVSCADLLTIAQRKTQDGSDSLAELLTVRLLILDDLGAKLTGGAWLSDVLFRIVDTRSRERRVTIFTSNVSLSELEVDDRVADRINRYTFGIALPEYCVRSREANDEKRRLLAELGID